MNKIFLIVFGTRPEAIKMAPSIKALKAETSLETKLCVTAQHREMLDQVLDVFDITPEYDLNILQPGAGVGGHCIAVDPWFIVYTGGEDARMIRTAREVNTYKAEWVIEKIKNAALTFKNEHGRKAKAACMGLAFKPDIDDLRESPALYIAKRLQADGLDILAVEPNIKSHKDFELVPYQDALAEVDIVTFLVAHKEFKDLDIETDLDFCGVLNR